MTQPRALLSRLTLPLAVIFLLLGGSSPVEPELQAAPDPGAFVCLPTCAENDGKFLAVTAQGTNSLAGTDIFVSLSAPPTSPQLSLGVFDGETGGMWDNAASTPLQFDVFIDPLGDGTGAVPVNLVQSVAGASLPDNAWAEIGIVTDVSAQACVGCPFKYILRISSLNPAASGTTYFKIRTDGTLGLRALPFAFSGALPTLAEANILYPNWPALTPTTYDGIWRFGFSVPALGAQSITVWDGDLDYGPRNCAQKDTDDPDSSAFPSAFVISPATVAEGAATSPLACPSGGGFTSGSPADDNSLAHLRRVPSFGANIVFRLFDPLGGAFVNLDPSGNSEWEQFVVDADPGTLFDRALMDYKADSLPAGVYEVFVEGVDLQNLNFFRFQYNLLGLPPGGPPACEDCFYRIERYVWHDTDRDGLFDADEAGIPGVNVRRRDTQSGAVQFAVTDATGAFTFRVAAGDYSLEVVSSNFDASKPLNGMYFTGNNGQGTHTGEFAEVPGMGPSKPYDRRDFGYVANTPPTANDDLGACACSSATGALIDVLANDSDLDNHALSVTSVTQPGFGTATLNADNTVTYVPNAGYIGADSFTYTVEDGLGGSATGIARVDVLSNPPTLADDAVAGNYGAPTVINVLANDSHPSGGTLAVTSVTQGQFGAVSINGDGTLSYTPNDLTFVGEDEFTYTVVTECGEATARVRITVPPPPPPCDPGGFTTYTPGGWGAKPSGNNPGMLLRNNFNRAYPGGSVSIGSGTRVLTFTSAKAIEVFLPLGGNPGVLSASATNPKTSVGGPFIGHLLSLQLAADFSRAGVLKSGLGNMAVLSGSLAGQTVDQILALANGVAGGTASLPSGVTLTSLQDTLVAIIMNYHEGTVNGGLLGCGGGTTPPPPPPPPTDPPTDPPPATGSGVCSGGVTKLVLKYIGSGSPSGVVSGQRIAPGKGDMVAAQVSGSSPVLYTFATTEMGGQFGSVSGGRLANNLSVFVGNTKIADVHTSCSVPIYPGMKVGSDFEIVALWTRGGGLY